MSELGRRKPHIDRVRYSNPLLPIGVLCLENAPERRPLMSEINDTLVILKTSEEYRISGERVGSNWSARQVIGTISRPVKHYYEPIEAFATKSMHIPIAMETGGHTSPTEGALEELAKISLHGGGRDGEEEEGGREEEEEGGKEEGKGWRESRDEEDGGEGEREGEETEEVGGGEGGGDSSKSPPTLSNGTSPPPPHTPNSEAPLQQNSRPLGEFSQVMRKQCIRCKVCRREMRYSLRAEKPVSMVKCGSCKEVTVRATPCISYFPLVLNRNEINLVCVFFE